MSISFKKTLLTLCLASIYFPAHAEETATTLEEVTVTSVKNKNKTVDSKSYSAQFTSTATKTDTPIMETPMSVEVVTHQALKDQQAWRLEDATKNVSGVQQASTFGQYQDFLIRGFGTNYARFRNGVRLPESTFDMANVEQVEVLKGGAAMLYGRTEPGGMINVITKKPLNQAYYSLQQQFGSYNFYRTTLDATGPITKDGSLAYRFNLGYTNSNSFRDHIKKENIFIAPSLHWQATANTEFNLNLEYRHDNPSMGDTGIPAIGNRVANVPINTYYSQPGQFNKDTIDSILIDFNWSHAFNDDWKISNGVVANLVDYEWRDLPVAYVQTNLEGANPAVRRGTYFEDFSRDNLTVYLNLNGKFETFGVKHNVLVGGDYYNLDLKNSGFFGLNHAIQKGFDPANGAFDYFSFIDLNNPDYSQYQRTFSELDNLRKNAPNDFGKVNTSWFGLYFQDQVSLFNDKLQILGGGRYDWTRQKQGSSMTSFADINESVVNLSRFSPKAGLLYRPYQWLSLYGNWTESFGISNNLSETGAPLKPETAEQFEAGIKTEWFDGQLRTNLAYFHIAKQNILTQVSETRFDTVGAARSQGIELDISGQLTNELSLIASYAFTDGRITSDSAVVYDDFGVAVGVNSGNQGKRLPNVAEHSGSAWLKYAVQEGQLQGLSFGVGAYLASARQGDNANSYQLPGYVRADAMVSYLFKLGDTKLTTQVNINNMFDKKYYFAGQPYNTSSAYNMPADPLTVLGSLKLEY